ncbi:MAG: glycosyltransferase family 4 protein [Ilumatobacteraceae bacterium]
MTTVPNVGFVLERALGHSTHADNLQHVISGDPRIRATWCPIAFDVHGLAARVPFYRSRWTLRAGVRARAAIRKAQRERPLDALFIHTQVAAVLSTPWMAKVPTVVSMDATPRQYDVLGAHYAHSTDVAFIEDLKYRANVRCLRAAADIVAWSSWAKDGLVADYGVPEEKVFVIPPGVVTEWWARPMDRPVDDDVTRILFVGGDFERKGGGDLLEAFRRLRTGRPDGSTGPRVELHLVTQTPVPSEPGVVVHGGLPPNSPELLALFHRCDVFCLPTRADTFALVLSEAGAAGLALVSTAVGGIPELVRDGDTGLLVPPDDVDALTQALVRLVDQPDLRRRLAANVNTVVAADFDATKNADRLVNLLLSAASSTG